MTVPVVLWVWQSLWLGVWWGLFTNTVGIIYNAHSVYSQVYYTHSVPYRSIRVYIYIQFDECIYVFVAFMCIKYSYLV